jgi:hypothetical protein
METMYRILKLSGCLCLRITGLTVRGYVVRPMAMYDLVAARVPMFTIVKLEKLSHPVWHWQWHWWDDTRQLQLLNMLEMRLDDAVRTVHLSGCLPDDCLICFCQLDILGGIFEELYCPMHVFCSSFQQPCL